MKLFKRFFPLKNGIGATALALALLGLASCENMTTLPPATMRPTATKTLYAPTFPEHTTDDQGNPISVTYGERYYTVSQGLKNKISLSWNKVEIAKYYEVFSAPNINDTFVKVGEPTTAQFEDSVGAGSTYYYKVRAVNTKGEFSEFSSVVKGTSLAKPAITDIQITDTSASVFWYMGNVGIDSYVKGLLYEVHAFRGNEEKVTTLKAWDEANQRIVEEYTFENLSGHTDYKFRVDAYIASDQNSVEKSPEVSKETLSLYTPVSPEFTASQGESTQHVKLFITLPSKIQVQTAEGDKDYPICFEIQRKRSTETNWTTIVPTLYFTGKTAKPETEDTASKYDAYKEGDIVEYDDTSAIRGAKYDYRILSCIDTNFSKANSYDYFAVTKSKENLAKTAQGWAAAMPEFSVKKGKPVLNDDESKILSISVSFNASWNDLGKANDYKFAIWYERSYNNGASTEEDWLLNSNLAVMFNNLEDICSFTKVYNLKEVTDIGNNEGTYTYTLYIFPAKYTDPSKIKGDFLVKLKADSFIGISTIPGEPQRDLKVEGGWKNKTLLTWTVEDGVDYRINWTKHDEDGTEVYSGVISSSDLPKDSQGNYTGSYWHTGLEGGYIYKYAIIANNSTPGNDDGGIPAAETLGTPAIAFESNSYTDINVSWHKVMAAEKYKVTLGTKNSFGDGVSFEIDKVGAVSGVPNTYEGFDVVVAYDDPSKTMSLAIKKPYGYNDATLSGLAKKLVVTAVSQVNAQNEPKDTSAADKDVWTIGPAALEMKATEDVKKLSDIKTTSITVTWKKLDMAKGYVVYRMRPKMTRNTDASGNVLKDEYASFDAYYVPETVSETATVLTSGNATVNLKDGVFTLTDIYKSAEGSTSAPAINQQYLALGIPFTYTVLPVMAEQASDVKEINYDMSELAYPAVGDAYKNIAAAQKIGYTIGYGVALEASKADYSNKVELNWERPESAIRNNLVPKVYWRPKGSAATDAWNKIDVDLAATAASASIIPDNKVQAREYAVTYGAMGSNSNPAPTEQDKSYADYQAGLKNLKITSEEPKCVGYMFTMPQIKPIKQDGSEQKPENETETVEWSFYDSDGDRAVGGSDITEYALELKNLNCSGTWWPIYTYDKDGVNTSTGSETWYDCNFNTTPSVTGATVTVTPTFKTNAGKYHDGLLKVQRDYKHYYRIKAKRNNSKGEEIIATSVDYAYRKITTDERNKCVGLICADAFNRMGMPALEGLGANKWSDPHELAGAIGKISIRHKSSANICRWGTGGGEYRHNFIRTPGELNEDNDANKYLPSGFIITISDTEGGALGGASGSSKVSNLQSLPSTSISITHECNLPSYTGSPWTVSGVPDSIYFPYEFGTQHKEGISGMTYIVTWTEWFQKKEKTVTLPTYDGLWWEVRQGGNEE